MKIKSIPSSWLREDEHRLDCGPFTSGSIETRKRLESLKFRKDKLAEVTKGGISGMYHVGQDKLQWVVDQNYGIRFLRSSDILLADFSNQPFIAKEQVKRNPLFQCPPGTTLITRSGTIGRMAYCRQEMAEMAISQDVLKVVPDTDKVLSGYLYAFLSSKFGVPMIIGGTFGSIIVHIEANNIADLPVPRLGEEIERQVHELVEKAAAKRTLAQQRLAQAEQKLFGLLSISSPKATYRYERPLTATINNRRLQNRMDAFYFSTTNLDARNAFDSVNSEFKTLQDVAVVFIPGIFKRRYALEPTYGYPYITGADVFELAPTSESYLMKSVAKMYDLELRKGMILIQEAGQLGGLIGRSVMVGRYLDGFACTNNMVRVTPKDERDSGYIYSILSCEYGVRLIARESAGSSIPHIEVSRMRNLRIPWPDTEIRQQIGEIAIEARESRDDACELENKARELVEQVIEGAT